MIGHLYASKPVISTRSSFDPLLTNSSERYAKLICADYGLIRNRNNLRPRAVNSGGLPINRRQSCSVIAQSAITSSRDRTLQDEQGSDNGTQINQNLRLVLHSIIDVILFIWRLPELIIGFIQREKEVIDKIEGDIDEVADVVKITAKVVEEIAEEVEKVAEIVEKDAKKVDIIMDEVKEKTKVVHDELEDIGSKLSEAKDKEVDLAEQEKTSKFSMINSSGFHWFYLRDYSRSFFLISTSIYSMFCGMPSIQRTYGWNVIAKTSIMALFFTTFLFLNGVQLTPISLSLL